MAHEAQNTYYLAPLTEPVCQCLISPMSIYYEHLLCARCCLGSVERAVSKAKPLSSGRIKGCEAAAGCATLLYGWLEIISLAGSHLSRDLEGGVQGEEASKPREGQV